MTTRSPQVLGPNLSDLVIVAVMLLVFLIVFDRWMNRLVSFTALATIRRLGNGQGSDMIIAISLCRVLRVSEPLHGDQESNIRARCIMSLPAATRSKEFLSMTATESTI
jgi:hypothetical protein